VVVCHRVVRDTMVHVSGLQVVQLIQIHTFTHSPTRFCRLLLLEPNHQIVNELGFDGVYADQGEWAHSSVGIAPDPYTY
jgi:hypothetical protein